jgi:hypothetical protein
MRRIIALSVLSLTLLGGVALADPGPRSRGRDRGRQGRVVRDFQRVAQPQRYQRPRPDRVRHQRRPVYVNNGQFHFQGGVKRVYTRPIIRQRYFNRVYRPQIVVEAYDPVPGYVWVQGAWQWNGREWIWTPGYYAPQASYQPGYQAPSQPDYQPSYQSDYQPDYQPDYPYYDGR